MTFLVLSSHTKPGSTAPINHQIYCRKHGYKYLFDATPYPLKSPYDQKLAAVCHNLEGADWLMWMDDDAYFMDHTIKLESFVDDQSDYIFCNSPVNPLNNKWTFINSGVFFVRNTPETKKLLFDALATDINMVKEWWDKDKYGFFTHGDQDRLLYQFVVNGLVDTKLKVCEFTDFNARRYHFDQRYDQHFVLHYVGYLDKYFIMEKFAKLYGLNRFMTTDSEAQLSEFRWSVFYEAKQRKMSSLRRFVRHLRRFRQGNRLTFKF